MKVVIAVLLLICRCIDGNVIRSSVQPAVNEDTAVGSAEAIGATSTKKFKDMNNDREFKPWAMPNSGNDRNAQYQGFKGTDNEHGYAYNSTSYTYQRTKEPSHENNSKNKRKNIEKKGTLELNGRDRNVEEYSNKSYRGGAGNDSKSSRYYKPEELKKLERGRRETNK
ncbi:unnamed protein product, partial [Strongylus vulgaris]